MRDKDGNIERLKLLLSLHNNISETKSRIEIKYILKNKIPQTLSNNLSLIRNYYFWNYKHFKIFLILIELNQIPRYMINLFIF